MKILSKQSNVLRGDKKVKIQHEDRVVEIVIEAFGSYKSIKINDDLYTSEDTYKHTLDSKIEIYSKYI